MKSAKDLGTASAGELLELYEKRALSPVEAMSALFERIERLEPKLNAFSLLDREGALAAARESERRWQKGKPKGALDGVPVTIKDLILMRGFPTLRGSRLVKRDQDWSEDAPASARLREAGAILFAKTTTPEFGWKAIGDSPLTGITRNPWNTEHTPGGSSAGAAAACAAGLGPLHLGSDGGGSIRIPSAFTGVFGLKPSFGRVPAYPLSTMGQLAHIGPMARSVRDAALMLTVIAGPDDRDPYALPPAKRDWTKGLEKGVKGWRIAFSPNLGYARVAPEIAASVAKAARVFASEGAEVEEVGEIFPSPREAIFTLWAAGAAKLLEGFTGEERALADPGLVALAKKGEAIPAIGYIGADALRAVLGRTMAAFHRKYDLLLTPSVPIPALLVGQDLDNVQKEGAGAQKEGVWTDWTPFSYPFNMTRQPAASIPCGLTSEGLPIGLQIVGPLYADQRVLRAARAFEKTQKPLCPPL